MLQGAERRVQDSSPICDPAARSHEDYPGIMLAGFPCQNCKLVQKTPITVPVPRIFPLEVTTAFLLSLSSCARDPARLRAIGRVSASVREGDT
jgi:hypothetical protein